MSYVGRFAPSPTGPLHRGSLLTAVGSWLDARAVGGEWLVRIENVDAQRCRAEYEHDILACLDAFGLLADHAPLRQSERLLHYAKAIALIGERLPLFLCRCSRRARRERADSDEDVCSGSCRTQRVSAEAALEASTTLEPLAGSLRVDLRALAPMQVEDRSLGTLRFDPTRQRDLILRRRDGFFSYALAVVVDDMDAGVTDVVRGADLAESTSWQLALYQSLGPQKPGIETPRYLHLPLLLDESGAKLSKSRNSLPANPERRIDELRHCLDWLKQQSPPADFDGDSNPRALLAWSAAHWRPEAFKGLKAQCLRDSSEAIKY